MSRMKSIICFYSVFFPLLLTAEFVEVQKGGFPHEQSLVPPPIAPFPEGTMDHTFENHGNYWAIVRNKENDESTVMVLPAQANDQWIADNLSGVRPGKWKWIEADYHGYLWISDGKELFKIDVNDPVKGLSCVSADSRFPEGKISCMGLGPNGLILVAMQNGFVVEIAQKFNSKTKRMGNQLSISEAPKNIKQILTDRDGNIWLKASNKIYKKDAELNAWQKNWEEVALLPAGTHDLSGDIYQGRFYMSWAISGDFGYPSTGAFHSKVLEFNPIERKWSLFADYGYPRGYGGTSHLGGKIWAVGGDAKDDLGHRYATLKTQIIDPLSKKVSSGPDLPTAIPSAISFHINERLYVLGYNAVKKGETKPIKLYSIGEGDRHWTEEPDGPEGYGSSYGTQLDGVIYTVVSHKYLAIFNTRTKQWSTSVIPNKPRSPAVGHFDGEIWVMGGRNKESETASYIYNPQTAQWRKGPDLPRPLVWGCAFNIDGDLYVTGGYSNHSSYNHRTFKKVSNN